MNKAHLGIHKTVPVRIGPEEILVDEGIAELVVWLNKLPTVRTYTSCQGGPRGEVTQRIEPACVGFDCESPASLWTICEAITLCGTITPMANHRFGLSVPAGQLPQLIERLHQERSTFNGAAQ